MRFHHRLQTRALSGGVLLLAAALAAGAPAQADVAGRATVFDADTIGINGQRIRLHGIDAPEYGQQCLDAGDQPYGCGKAAARALRKFIGAAPVVCSPRAIDRYGRMVARCLVRDESLNAWLVRQGYAVAYRRYSGDYVAEESEARNARRGLWSGAFDAPWKWRNDHRRAHDAPAPARQTD
jgi:endonuclease YncB( thermonuclease family)